MVCDKHHYLLAEIEAIILEATTELHTYELEVAVPFLPTPMHCMCPPTSNCTCVHYRNGQWV